MELKYAAAWAATQRMTLNRFRKIKSYFSTLKQAWDETDLRVFKMAGLDLKFIEYLKLFKSKISPEVEYNKLLKYKIRLISIEDKEYPILLKEIHNPPVFLYIKGKILPIDNHGIAVVGTRKCSNYGQKITRDFTQVFVQNKLTIISGLAFGIDAIAHQTALNNNGRTIAVLGSGLSQITPISHASLATRIINQGAIISEYPPETEVFAYNFPKRNRLVAGMTRGTLVIEAGERSGALITSRLALEENREVFVISGNIDHPQSWGCNQLIAKGEGKLVLSPKDVLSELQIAPQIVKTAIIIEKDPIQRKLCEILSNIPMLIDQILIKMEMSISELQSHLTMLEMRGVVKNMGNGYWTRG